MKALAARVGTGSGWRRSAGLGDCRDWALHDEPPRRRRVTEVVEQVGGDLSQQLRDRRPRVERGDAALRRVPADDAASRGLKEAHITAISGISTPL